MAKGVEFACPNCGKKNFVAFSQIKTNRKAANVPIAFPCGCSLPPNQVLDQLAEQVISLLSKTKPKPSE